MRVGKIVRNIVAQPEADVMVIVHNVFRLKFGEAREAVSLMKEAVAIRMRLGVNVGQRLLQI